MRTLTGTATWVVGAILAAALVGCGGEDGKQTPKTGVKGTPPGTLAPATTAAGKAQTMCPVLPDNKIDRSIFADYKGQRVYFCCAMCQPKFKAEPEKYLAAMGKEGIILEKSPEGSK